MRKSVIWVLGLVLLSSCGIENDMMLPKDVAGFSTFAIDGQVSSSINTTRRTVTVTMPDGVALNALKISDVTYTDVTFGQSRLLSAGDVVDLSDTLRVRLMAFREFDWKLVAVNAEPTKPGEQGPQLYNMSFDDWLLDGKGYYPYGEFADDVDKAVWTTANKGTANLIGKNTTIPEDSFVAVPGAGKHAAKLSSDYFLIKFAAGNLFTGEFVGLIGTKGADLAWGTPFTARPKSLKGYYCYQPKTITDADNEHKDMIGKTDVGQIQVILADWSTGNPAYDSEAIDEQGRFHVRNADPNKRFVDYENDPQIIGYGNFEFDDNMENYEEFEIPIEYRSDRTPKVVVIVCASSRYGDYFTGARGTVLYLDEFSFEY